MMSPDRQNLFRFHPRNRGEVFIWQISSPLTEIPGTEPARSLIGTYHIKYFTKDLEVRRDLGNQTYVKRPLISLFIAQK